MFCSNNRSGNLNGLRRNALVLFTSLFVLLVFPIALSAQNTKAVQPPDQKTIPEAGQNLIFVLPVKGTPRRVGLILADAIAASLRDIGAPAILVNVPNTEGPTITASARKVRTREHIVWIELTWKLLAPYGTPVVDYRHELVLDEKKWQTGSIEAINLIVDQAQPEIRKMVRDYVGPSMLATANDDQPVEMIAPRAKPVANVPERVRPVIKVPPPPQTAPQTLPQVLPQPKPTEKAKKPVMTVTAPKKLVMRPEPTPAETKKPRATPPPRAVISPTTRPVISPTARPVISPTARPATGPPTRLTPGAQATPPPVAETRAEDIVPAGEQEKPIIWGRPAFLIKPVMGAPGNGNRELTTAIKKALRARDLTISDDPRQAGYVVSGKVTVSDPVNGRQRTSIVWTVKTLNGQEVGRAVQENAVRAGSLDGRWGRVAVIVAKAAADGIEGLFDPDGKPLNSGQEPPPFSSPVNLPHIPGRAPPPPNQ